MGKTLHSRHNTILLDMLRGLRERKRLRQTDLAVLLGKSQATVSKVERGERRLDVIQLMDWIAALDISFLRFVRTLDAELRTHGITDPRIRQRTRRRQLRAGATRRRPRCDE